MHTYVFVEKYDRTHTHTHTHTGTHAHTHTHARTHAHTHTHIHTHTHTHKHTHTHTQTHTHTHTHTHTNTHTQTHTFPFDVDWYEIVRTPSNLAYRHFCPPLPSSTTKVSLHDHQELSSQDKAEEEQ